MSVKDLEKIISSEIELKIFKNGDLVKTNNSFINLIGSNNVIDSQLFDILEESKITTTGSLNISGNNFNEPAVPSGSSSRKYCICTFHKLPSPKYSSIMSPR